MAWTEKLPSGRYRGRYEDTDGHPHTAADPATGQKSHTSKRHALRLAADEEAKIRAGSWVDPRAGAISFGAYFEQHWIPAKVAELNTTQFYWSMYRAKRFGLQASFGDTPLRAIRGSGVQTWVKQMIDAGLSPRTIEARFRALQTILAGQRGVSALRDRLIAANPCAGIDLPVKPEREVQIYEPDEADALLDALDPWWVPVVALAVDLGLRWGELLGLQVEDFAFGHTTVTVRRTIVETAAGKTATAPGSRPSRTPRAAGSASSRSARTSRS
jgi:hypothetical protein